MPDTLPGPSVPPAFAAALEAIRRAKPRAELVVTEIPAPGGLAPWSIALAADVTPAGHGADSDYGTGRFILLYDPAAPEAWGGVFRVVCFVQAPLETEIGLDPFLASVAWSRILSTGFGDLESQGDGAQIELRASWTPLDHHVTAHVEGWSELLCMLAGFPPTIEGVSVLSTRRASRE